MGLDAVVVAWEEAGVGPVALFADLEGVGEDDPIKGLVGAAGDAVVGGLKSTISTGV